MNIEKLIEQLRTESLYADKASLGIMDLCMDAATALSTLQAENKRLNKIVCSIPTTPDSGRTVSQYDKEMSMCAYLDDLEAENEKLRAELERVKKKNKYSAHDVALILSDAFGDSCACNFNGNDEWLPEKCELLDTCPDVVGVACWEQYLKWLGQKED